MTLGGLLRERALQMPQKTALFSGETAISYRQLDDASDRLAGWLLRQGLGVGDRMAIHWHNSFEAALLYFACFKSGIIAVPVNLRLKPAEIAYILQNSGASLCVSAPAMAPLSRAAAELCPGLRGVITEIPPDPPGGSLPNLDPGQSAVIMYTSGTTARPKGVECSHQAFLAFTRLAASEFMDGTGIGVVTTPMMHSAALAIVISSIYGGESVVLLPGFDPSAILDAIEKHRCTYTVTLPALLQFIMDEQARRPRDVRSLKNVMAGGDSVPPAMQERFAELFGMPLQEFYGSTEGAFVSLNPQHAVRPGSMGLPMAAVQVRIVDAAGRDVPEGETGEIVLRGPSAAQRYWNDPQASAELLRGGWLHTGDLASRDADGYLWFRGRTKQIIVRAGSNISPQEVEEAMYRHPAVREVGVVGKPDAVYGELVVAFVALRSAETAGLATEIRDFARERLADYKVPEEILFLPELPKGLTGKVDRRTLKEMLAVRSATA